MTRDSSPGRSMAVLAILALVVASCGAATTPTSGPASEGPASGGPASSPVGTAPAAASGGTLKTAAASDFQSFDPAVAYDVNSWWAERLLYDGLVGYDKTTTLVPIAAEALPTISADGTTYTFKLRSGINFVKGDGSILRQATADDVVYSINRVLNPNLKPSPSPVSTTFFAVIEGASAVIDGSAPTASGIKAIDASTVEFKLTAPDPTFLNKMALPFASIVPKEMAGEDTLAFSNAPVGIGPFYLQSYTKGQKAVFARNTHYFIPNEPRLDAVEIAVGVDATTSLQQVETNNLDFMADAIPSGAYTATVNDPTFKDRIFKETGVNTIFLAMDTSGPNKALQNLKVRQAIQHAIDKEAQVKLDNGHGEIANCIFPPAMPGYDPTCKPYDYNLDTARQLMKEAGYPDGFKTTIYTDTTEPDPASATAIQQDLKQIGIDANIVLQQFDVLVGTISTPHAAELTVIGWFQDFPDPSNFVDPFLSCQTNRKGASNFGWYCNPAVDELSAKAKSITDRAAYLKAYQDIQAMIMADSPDVGLYHQQYVTLVSERVADFYIHPVWVWDMRHYALKP